MPAAPSARFNIGLVRSVSPRNPLRRSGYVRSIAALGSLLIIMSLMAIPGSAASPAGIDNGSWLHTDGSRIVTESGDAVTIRAVNWFGMETSNCAPHGLWQISLDQAMDQIASFGFNAVRLPYSSECLAAPAASVSGVDSRLNPGLQGLTPLQIMDRVVDAAAARGLRIILDRHRPDSGAQSELWYTDRFSERQWIDDWVTLAERYRDRPTVVGADLQNEPHGRACWGCGDPAVDWAGAATRAGNAVLAANPHWLIIVEGVERQSTAGTTWWGGGLADVALHPITLSVPGQLVYSAHDYPSSIFAQSWFADPSYPANLPGVWDRNWGYLQQQGIAPVLLGEFGTKLTTASDVAWLDALVGYLGTRQMSFAYWSYNPNSGDTGGLIADDWHTPQQAKLDALAPLLGAGGGTASVPPSASPPASPAPAPASTSTSTSPPPATTTVPAPVAPQTPTSTSAPPATTSPPAAVAPSPPNTAGAPGSGITASWQLQSSWPTGYVAQLVVTAAGEPVDGWSVSWPDRHATAISSSWGLACTLSNGDIHCRGAAWAGRIPSGGSVTVGLLVATDGVSPAAPALTIG